MRGSARAREEAEEKIGGSGGKVALFATCSVNYNNPEIGKSALAVLAHHDVRVVYPDQRCCGMPYLDGGDYKNAKENLAFNVRSFRRYAEEGYTIVVLQPTCGYVLKNEYPWLDDGGMPRVRSPARPSTSASILMLLHERGKLDTSFKNSPGKVFYHLPCHLKAQNIGYKSRDLLAMIPGTQIEMVERCSGMDGTWGMKKQYYEESLKVARRLFAGIEEFQPNRVCSDCALAGLQIEQGTGRKAVHPIEVLCEAYGLGFEV